MTGNRRETQAARYLQNVFDVPYGRALRTVRNLNHAAWGFAKVSGEGYLNVLERMAAKTMTLPGDG